MMLHHCAIRQIKNWLYLGPLSAVLKSESTRVDVWESLEGDALFIVRPSKRRKQNF